MPPLPTTARHIQDQSIIPHAESHEQNGADPILESIRFLGSVTIGEATANNYSHSTSGAGPGYRAYADVTGLGLTVNSRGGNLLVYFIGTWYAISQHAGTTGITPAVVFTVTLDGTTTTEQDTFMSVSDNGAAFVGAYASSSAMIWHITGVLPGAHTLQLREKQYENSGYTVTVHVGNQLDGSNGSASLLVFELLSQARG